MAQSISSLCVKIRVWLRFHAKIPLCILLAALVIYIQLLTSLYPDQSIRLIEDSIDAGKLKFIDFGVAAEIVEASGNIAKMLSVDILHLKPFEILKDRDGRH